MTRDELAAALMSDTLNRVVHIDGEWEWRATGPYEFADAILAALSRLRGATEETA